MTDIRHPKVFKTPIRIDEAACFGSVLEKEGPLGKYLDGSVSDKLAKDETWEKNESQTVSMTVQRVMEKSGKSENEIGVLLGGDLMNQCTGCAYGVEKFDIPYLGLYGACSTFVQAITVGSCLIEAKMCNSAIALASSNFCTAERQYRFPLNYGSFPKATSQHTVTGCGAVLLQAYEDRKPGVYVKSVLPGIVIDRGITNAANMGAAMATAAADTILRFLKATDKRIEDYSVIATGDLGRIGLEMAKEMLTCHGYDDNRGIFTDCGVQIYDLEKQDVSCGGSGCGCSAVTFSGYYYDSLKKGIVKNMLLVGTGAMMSPQSLLQGLSIPAIAHLVEIEVIE
ncbi:MAG: stage V sporulation protein AD [Clostridia bacterium]|nr:stage V sporulation protein AD [Clostridia bacterium]